MASEIKVDTISEKTSANGVTIDGVLIKDGAIPSVASTAFTILDSFGMNGDLSSTGYITSWTAIADGGAAKHNIGSSMTESSGVFTFPETGIYKVEFWARIDYTYSSNINLNIDATGNNSSYSTIASGATAAGGNDDGVRQFPYVAVYVDVSDVANVKIKFETSGTDRTYTRVRGNGTSNETNVRFTKVGST